MLSCGVREYLSSKFEDYELITSILRLEEEYKEEINEIIYLLYEQLKYLLLEDEFDINLANNIDSILSKHITNMSYKVICTNYKMKQNINSNCLYFKNIQGHNVIIIKSDIAESFIDKNLNGFGLGISKEYTDIKLLIYALNEGIKFREQNFFMQSYRKEIINNTTIEDYEIERFIQLIGSRRLEVNYDYLKRIIMSVKRCETTGVYFFRIG